jgi:hypothetical protein
LHLSYRLGVATDICLAQPKRKSGWKLLRVSEALQIFLIASVQSTGSISKDYETKSGGSP